MKTPPAVRAARSSEGSMGEKKVETPVCTCESSFRTEGLDQRRMFAIVDVFDALTSVRPYRAAWSHEAAYRYIQEESGKHFDPRVVRIFLENK